MKEVTPQAKDLRDEGAPALAQFVGEATAKELRRLTSSPQQVQQPQQTIEAVSDD